MRGLRVVGVCVLVWAASGCWWQLPGEGPDRQAYNGSEHLISVGNVGALTELWAAPVDSGPVSDPVTSVRGVHVADASSVYGFDPRTGARLWAHSTAGGGVQQPYVRGEQVMVGSIDQAGNVGPTVALDAASGSIVDEITSDGVLVALRDERAALWTRVQLTDTIHVTVVDVVDLETSALPCCDGRWFSGDSLVPAELTLGADLIFHAGDGLTHPDIDNLGNGVRAYSIPARPSCPVLAEAHCPVWARPIDGTEATVPVLDDDGSTLYVGTDAGTLYAIDAQTGDTRWTAAVGSPIIDAPALADNTLYIPTVGGLVVVDATGCSTPPCMPLWTGDTVGEVTQQPAVASGLVFIGGSTGQVAAFDADGCATSTCAPLWSATTNSPITGAPAVSNGRIHVGTANGELITFGHPPGQPGLDPKSE